MEAALRTAVSKLAGSDKAAEVDYLEVRGLQGVKEATYKVGGTMVKVAVVNGIKNAKAVCEAVKQGKADYQFVEVMTCPGGCVMGGGQPVRSEYVKSHDAVQQIRAGVLYGADAACAERRSHQNK